jgi:hypothetical protein
LARYLWSSRRYVQRERIRFRYKTLNSGEVFNWLIFSGFPQVGTHTITVNETKAVVNGANVGTSLLGDSFDINITIGAYERLCVAGSPQTKYSPSFGANVLASEVRRCALNYSPFVQLFFEAFEFIVLTRILPPWLSFLRAGPTVLIGSPHTVGCAHR